MKTRVLYCFVVFVVILGFNSTRSYSNSTSEASAAARIGIAANLANFKISNGVLSPAFSANVTSYTASVNNGTTSITVTPTLRDDLASATVNGTPVATRTASAPLPLAVGPNTITTIVTAPDGVTTKTYTLTVTRAAQTNSPNLSDLKISKGVLTPAFNAATTSYTTSVLNNITSITLTPFVQDATASVTVNGNTVTSGSASQSIPLVTGANTITTVVTAGDGVTTKTYTLTVTREIPANAANLANLDISSGTLSPAFIANTTTYTASVTNATTSITVTPTLRYDLASVTINGTPVASRSASSPIALAVGDNIITAIVTAVDGTTTKTYTLTVNRAAASNSATLASFTISSGTLSPAFNPAVVDYTAGVTNATTSITVTPSVSDAGATVTVNGVAVVSGNASQSIPLAVGANTISTVVTAQDGITTKTYTLTVNRAIQPNLANLANFQISTGTLTPAFSANTTSYTVSLSNAIVSITVTPTLTDPAATVTVNGTPVTNKTASAPIPLPGNLTTITTVVTATDGVTTKTYTLTVIKAGTSNVYTWTGAGADANWSNNNNWSPSTGHPLAGDTVFIANTVNPPSVDVSSACQSITITGATTLALLAPLNISDGITLNASLGISGAAGNLSTRNIVAAAGTVLNNSSTINLNSGTVSFGANADISNLAGGVFNVKATTIKLGNAGFINNNTGAKFIINSGSAIDFAANAATNGYVLNAGTFAAGTSNSACTINLNFQGANIQNTGTFNLGSTSVINLTATGSQLNNTGTFTLQSDAIGSATIGQIAAGSSGCAGIYNVERYITGGSSVYRSYRLLSSPVYTATANGNNIYSLNYITKSSLTTGTGGIPGGFDRGGNPSLYLYRDNIAASNISFTSGNFRGISNISAAPSYSIDVDGSGFNIPVANGFMFFFRGDRTTNLANKFNPGTVAESVTMTATGTLNTGAIRMKQWFTPLSSNVDYTPVTGNEAVVGFALTGNPYASSIDWDTYNTGSATTGVYAPSVTPFIYILDPVSKNYNVYSAGFDGVGTIATAESNIIPSGQGFFVQASDPTAQLIFNESAKTNKQVSAANHNVFLGTPPLANIKQYLNLKLSKDAEGTDGIFINFNSTAKNNFSVVEDAAYKPGNGAGRLSSRSGDNVELAINSIALPKQVQTTIGLNVNGDTDGLYKLNLAAVKSIPELYDIWLMDAYKNDSLDIKHNPTYNFNIYKSDAASFGAGRFSLVIRQNPALGVHLLDFTAAKDIKGAQINWKTENEQNYTHFTVERSTDNGKTFEVTGGFASAAQGTYGLLDGAPVNGSNLYRLKLEDLNGTISYSKAVTVMYTNGNNNLAKSLISVYPNPAVGTINLAMPQTGIAATYGIQIVNNTGAVVKAATSTQAGWQADISKYLPGTYVIQVINNKDKTVVGKGTFVKL